MMRKFVSRWVIASSLTRKVRARPSIASSTEVWGSSVTRLETNSSAGFGEGGAPPAAHGAAGWYRSAGAMSIKRAPSSIRSGYDQIPGSGFERALDIPLEAETT
jgi:hypothetical protein